PFVLAPSLVNPLQPQFGAPQVALGDVNGDGLADVIVAFGPNNAPLVTVINGNAVVRAANNPGNPFLAVGTQPGDFLGQFFAFQTNFRGGLFVSAGDINKDGKAEIVVGTDAGTVSTVRVFMNFAPAGAQGIIVGALGDLQPYGGFTGGVRVAVGDVNGDGFADIITGSGVGARPHIKVFDGATGILAQSFFAYDTAFLGGVYVNAGDFDGDGRAEILVGAGAGAQPHVKIFRGDFPGFAIASFIAFPETPALSPSPASQAVFRGVSSVAFGGLDTATG